MSLSIFDLGQYVQRRKLTFRPDVLLQLISEKDKWSAFMITTKVKKFLGDPSNCIHCQKQQSKQDALDEAKNTVSPAKMRLCKKHAAVFAYETTCKRHAMVDLWGKQYYLFGEYAATAVPKDPDGLYIIWFPALAADGKNLKPTVFAIHNRYFQNIATSAIDINETLKYDILTVDNRWMLHITVPKPSVERMK